MAQPRSESAARPFAYTILAGLALGLAIASSPRSTAPRLADRPATLAQAKAEKAVGTIPASVEVAPGARLVLASPERPRIDAAGDGPVPRAFDTRPVAVGALRTGERLVGWVSAFGRGAESHRAELADAALLELIWRVRYSPKAEMLKAAGRTIERTRDRVAGASSRTAWRYFAAAPASIRFEVACAGLDAPLADGSIERDALTRSEAWRSPVSPGDVLASPEPMASDFARPSTLEREHLARPRVGFPAALR